MPLLDVADLRVAFHTRDGVFRAVDGADIELEAGEILGLVGESGSGKSVSCSALLGLLPSPPARVSAGRARLGDLDLLRATPAEMRTVRGRRISMIFQDPMTSLNPYMRVGEQIMEPLLIHEKASRRVARDRAVEMLAAVGIADPATRLEAYPHQFSGGMRQRVMIAMALITRPQLLIADEPTTALDVTVQAQILELIARMRRELGMAVIFVSHDLAVVANLCDRVQVMYAGRVVERAAARELLKVPAHPYTRALRRSIPGLQDKGSELYALPGLPPDLSRPLPGCAFAQRCEFATERCRTGEAPALVNVDGGRAHACLRVHAGEV